MQDTKKKNNKVNINGLMNYFQQVITKRSDEFKPSYIALLYFFFYKNNQNFWQSEFEFTKSEAFTSSGIRSKPTFREGLKFLTDAGLIRLIYVPNNRHHNYIATFHPDIKVKFFNNYQKNPTGIDPNYYVGIENTSNSTGQNFYPVNDSENNSTGQNFLPIEILPGKFFTITGQNFLPIIQFTPLLYNKHKNIFIKRASDAKKNAGEQKKNNRKNEKVEMDINSEFYGWPISDIKKFNEIKTEFYNHQHRIFHENMRHHGITRPQIEKYAQEFWQQIKSTGDWNRHLNGHARHFFNWIKLRKEKENANNSNGKRQRIGFTKRAKQWGFGRNSEDNGRPQTTEDQG